MGGNLQLFKAEKSQQHPKALSFRAVTTLKQNHAAQGCPTHAEALSAAEAQLLMFSASPCSRSAIPMLCSPWGWISHTQGCCAQLQLQYGNSWLPGITELGCGTAGPLSCAPRLLTRTRCPAQSATRMSVAKRPPEMDTSTAGSRQIHAHSAAREDNKALGWRNAPWGLPSAQSSRRQGRQTALMPGYFLQRTASGQGRDSLSEGTAAGRRQRH